MPERQDLQIIEQRGSPVTAMHFARDPVPVLPSVLAPAARKPRLLERLFQWIDEGLADLDSDD